MTLDGLGMWFTRQRTRVFADETSVQREALMNVDLSFTCHRTDFSTNSELTTSTDMIKLYGVAIAAAEKLSGSWILYKDGSMERGFREDLEVREAAFDIDEIWGDLNHIMDVTLREVPRAPYGLHFHFKDGDLRRIAQLSSRELRVY